MLGSTRVMPSNGTENLRGVFSIEPEADLSSARVYLETGHPGMTFTNDAPKFYLASDLSNPAVTPNMPNVTDEYSPCTIRPEHGYTVVYEVALPQGSNSSDNLNIFMCSPGGYDQVRPFCCHHSSDQSLSDQGYGLQGVQLMSHSQACPAR